MSPSTEKSWKSPLFLHPFLLFVCVLFIIQGKTIREGQGGGVSPPPVLSMTHRCRGAAGARLNGASASADHALARGIGPVTATETAPPPHLKPHAPKENDHHRTPTRDSHHPTNRTPPRDAPRTFPLILFCAARPARQAVRRAVFNKWAARRHAPATLATMAAGGPRAERGQRTATKGTAHRARRSTTQGHPHHRRGESARTFFVRGPQQGGVIGENGDFQLPTLAILAGRCRGCSFPARTRPAVLCRAIRAV